MRILDKRQPSDSCFHESGRIPIISKLNIRNRQVRNPFTPACARRTNAQMHSYCGWTKFCTAWSAWETTIVGIYRGIIIPEFLRWCRNSSVHSRPPPNNGSFKPEPSHQNQLCTKNKDVYLPCCATSSRIRHTHWLSGWPKKGPNFLFTTKIVFQKSLQFINSGSEHTKDTLISPWNGIRISLRLPGRNLSAGTATPGGYVATWLGRAPRDIDMAVGGQNQRDPMLGR